MLNCTSVNCEHRCLSYPITLISNSLKCLYSLLSVCLYEPYPDVWRTSLYEISGPTMHVNGGTFCGKEIAVTMGIRNLAYIEKPHFHEILLIK